MKGKLSVALIAIVGAWLVFANPTMEDFRAFAQSQSRGYLEDELGDHAVGRALAQAGSSLAHDLVDQITNRKNYIFFSVYTVGDHEDGDAVKYLGIGGEFIKTGSE